jgi:hypothetical protein
MTNIPLFVEFTMCLNYVGSMKCFCVCRCLNHLGVTSFNLCYGDYGLSLG